jgi:hypothetical protein
MITKGDSENRQVVILDDSSTFLLQTEMDFSIKSPKVQSDAPNGYTQARNVLLVKSPFVLDNGNRTVNTIRVELAVDHELTSAERQSLIELAVHTLVDSDFADYWEKQSVA